MSLWTRRVGIQLAYPYEEKRLAKYGRPLLVQPKLNGERCRAIIKRGAVTLLSSEENEITTLPHIPKLLACLSFAHLELDGELYCHGMSKQQIGSFIRRKNPKEGFEQINFHVFDIVDENVCQLERLALFYQYIACLLTHPVETYRVEGPASIQILLYHYMAEGYEGVIVRNPLAKYQRKRTTDMMKWKPRGIDSYLIVDYKEEIDIYGTPKGALGSLLLESDGERFSVGSGSYFTRSAREHLWTIRETLPGKYATVKYPELTDRGVPNHPVIVEITNEKQEEL